MHEGQEYRLERQVVPFHVEGGRPHEHSSAADAPLDERGRPVVETRDDLGVGRHGDRSVAVEPCRGKISAARRAERLEDRIAVLERAQACRRTRRAIDGRARQRRQEVGPARGPGQPRAGHEQQAAAALDERREPRGRELRDGRVVQHHDRGALEIVDRQPLDGLDRHVEGRRLTERQRARQIQARVARRARPFGNDDSQRLLRRHDEVERVVHEQRILTEPDSAPRVARRRRERREGDRRGPAGLEVQVLLLHGPSVHFEADLDVLQRAAPVIHGPARDRHAVLLRKRGALQRHGRDAEVDRVRIGHGHGRQRRAIGQPDAVGADPAAALEVRHENHFAARQRRFAQDAAGQLQRRSVMRGARSRFLRRDRRVEPRPIGRRAQRDFRAGRKEHDGRAVAGPERRDGIAGPGHRTRPPVAVRHAVRAIHEHHDLARAPGRRGRHRRAPEERPRKGQHDERERRQAQEQQRPVADPAAAHRLVGNPLEEHQRGKLDDVLPLALDQMDHDRHGKAREAEQEEWRQERHVTSPSPAARAPSDT